MSPPLYSDHEQSPEAIIRKFLIVQTEGIRQVEWLVDFYSPGYDPGHRISGEGPLGRPIPPIGHRKAQG